MFYIITVITVLLLQSKKKPENRFDATNLTNFDLQKRLFHRQQCMQYCPRKLNCVPRQTDKNGLVLLLSDDNQIRTYNIKKCFPVLCAL